MNAPPKTAAEAPHYPSFTALRARHNQLLKLHREAPGAARFQEAAREFLRQAQATGRVLDSDADRDAAQTLLDYWSTMLFRAGVEVPDAPLADFDPTLEPALTDDQCPYRRFEEIQPDQTNLYFGRQRLLKECLDQLRQNSCVAVTGPCGSGRSSLVRAILLPALQAGALPGSENWRGYSMRAGPQMWTDLVRDLFPARAEKENWWVREQAKIFADNPAHLAKVLDGSGPQPALLVVDELEQILGANSADAEALLDNLLTLADRAGTPHKVVLILNSQYLDDVAQHDRLCPILTRQVFVSFDANELRQAIEEPAKLVGLKFEEGLVDKLLLDVTGDPSSVTLLRFTLLRLWNERQGNRITWAAYNRLGGGRVALARAAETAYAGLTPPQQDAAHTVILLAARLCGGREVRRVPITEAALAGVGRREDVDAVLNKFINAGLMCRRADATGAPVVELAHEALLNHWPRLVDWLDEKRDAARRRRERRRMWAGIAVLTALVLMLSYALVMTRNQARASEESHRLQDELNSNLLAAATAETDAAKKMRAREAADAAAKLLHEEELTRFADEKKIQAQSFATLQSEKRKEAEDAREREGVLRAEAERQGRFAFAQKLALEAPMSLDERGPLLARQAFLFNQASGLPIADQVDHALRVVLSRPANVVLRDNTAAGSGAPVFSIGFAPDGSVVAAGRDGSVRAWDPTGGRTLEPRALAAAGNFGAAGGATVSADGSLLAVRLFTNVIVVQSLTDNRAPRILRGEKSMLFRPVFSPDGQILATACARGFAHVWDLRKATDAPFTISASEAELSAIAFSTNSQVIALGARDGVVRLFNAQDGGPVTKPNQSLAARIFGPQPDPDFLQGSTNSVTAIAFHPDGATLALGDGSGSVQLWDLAHKTNGPVTLPGTRGVGVVSALAFNATGRFLAAASWDGTVQVWDLSGSERTATPLRGHQDGATSLAFSADSRWLASGSIDKTVRLWSMLTPADLWPGPAMPRVIRTRKDVAFSAAFSADGSTLAVGLWDGRIQVFRLGATNDADARPLNLSLGNAVLSVALSRNGNMLAAGSMSGTVRWWDLTQTNGVSVALPDFGGSVLSVALSADAEALAAAGINGEVRVWKDKRADDMLKFTNHRSGVIALAFSADKTRIASGSWDGTACVTALDGSVPGKVFSNGEMISAVAFSPDGRTFIAGAADGIIYRWDLAGGNRALPPLVGHEGRILSLAFDRTGRRLVSGSLDNTTRLWDLAATDSPAQNKLRGQTSRVLAVAFAADGTVLSSSAEETMLSWIGRTEELADQICRRGGRLNFTTNEWIQYVGSDIPYQCQCAASNLAQTVTPPPTTARADAR